MTPQRGSSGIAHDCLSGGHIVSAREAFLRASTYWKTGQFYLESKDPRQLEMYQRHRSCFVRLRVRPANRACQHSLRKREDVARVFHARFATGGPRPTVMIIGGVYTTCEELYYWGGGAAAVRRGYNAFLWEGPGQVPPYSLDSTLTYRPDWEVPTRYAVDYVLSRKDVDPERLALSGHSFGGYFAPLLLPTRNASKP